MKMYIMIIKNNVKNKSKIFVFVNGMMVEVQIY